MLPISVDNEMSTKYINRTGKNYLSYNFQTLKNFAL